MKTALSLSATSYQRLAIHCKRVILLLILFCTGTSLYAGTKLPGAYTPAKKIAIKADGLAMRKPNLLVLPTISYTTPQTYYAGQAITPLTPTSSGVAAPGYGSVTTFASGFSAPYRVAFDAAGNAYVSDGGTGFVVKIPVGGGSRVNLGTGIASPAGVAVNAVGTFVYVADLFGGNVKKIQVSNNATTNIGSGFSQPYGVALDAAGNVYVADAQATVIKEILAGTNTVVSLGSGFSGPVGVAVDAANNVYVADSGDNAVKKIAAGSGTVTTIGSGFSGPYDVAVDNAGNVFVADLNNNKIKEIPASGGAVTTVRTMTSPESVTVNGAGAVFSGSNSSTSPIVSEVKPTGGYYIDKPLPAGLSFNTSTGVISGTPTAGSPATTYTVTGYNTSGSASATISITVNANTPDLSNLTISTGTLTPAFSSAVTSYTAAVTSNTAFFSLVPTVANAGATITVNGVTVASGSSSGSVSIVTGANVFTIVVTAPVGGATKTYTLTVNRPSGNDYLSNLTISNGTLSPAFTLGNNNYSVNVGYFVTSVTVTPTADDINATLLVNGSPVASGSPSAALTIPANGLLVEVKVTAQDGTSYIYYVINVNRGADVPALTYTSPQTYHVGTTIAPLTPTNPGGPLKAQSYGPSQVFASGLNLPDGVAVDNTGNVFITSGNAVKEYPAGGGAAITLGSGSFSSAFGICTDAAGNIYVANYGGGAINEIRAGTNKVLTLVSGLSSPTGVAVDALGYIYFTEYSGGTVKKIPPGGGTPVVVASGYADAEGLALDNSGNMYVVSELATTIAKISPIDGTVTQIGSGLNSPIGIAVDGSGNVYVGDNNNNRVVEFPAGTNTVNVVATGFNHPAGVCVDPVGNVYVANSFSSNAYEVKPTGGVFIWPFLPAGLNFNNTTGAITGKPTAGGLTTNYSIAAYDSLGMGTSSVTITVNPNVPVFSYSTPKTYQPGVAITPLAPVSTGGAVAPRNYSINGSTMVGSGFAGPTSVAFDAAGNMYVGDYQDHLVYKLPVGGGAPISIGTGFSQVSGVAVDSQGNVFVADQGHSALKEILASDGSTITIASGFSSLIYGIATDKNDNVYVDKGNGMITKIPPGGGAGSKVPNAVSGSFALAVDGSGNLFEVTNGGVSVTEVHADGSPNTLIGSGLSMPYGIAVDGGGNVYVADNAATFDAIKMFPADGSAMILIGKGLGVRTYGVAVDGYGNVYMADQSTTTGITKIPPVGNYFVKPFLPAGLILDSNTGIISGTPATITPAANYVVTGYNSFGNASATVSIAAGTPGVNANLSALKLSVGTLAPVFSTATTSYSATVANATASITVTPTTTDPNATVKVNGTTVVSGTASGPVALNVGQNIITTVVTAQNGTTTKSYTVTVTRSPSVNASLASMNPSITPLSPTFTPATTGYTLSVANTVASMTVKPITSDANATIKVNGITLGSGTISAPIALAEGAQTVISVVVTAQDGTTTKTYTITVTRAASAVATLSNIKLSTGALSPAFATGTVNYTASVPNTVTSVTLTPTTTDANATVTVNGATVASGTASGAIALVVGANKITTIITAQNGTTTKTYTVTVNRSPSVNANLASMGPSVTPLSPTFTPATTSYTLAVKNTVTSMTVKPVTSDANATIKVNGAMVVSGTVSQAIALAVGANVISVVVTAQDGTTTKTYTINATRASGGADSYDTGISVTKPIETVAIAEDGIAVHPAISPNGDGLNDFLQIDNISQYPENKLTIMNRNGQLIYEAKGYDNSSKTFDGHSSKNGQMQLPGTYFYSLDYTVNNVTKHKTGFIVLKY